MSGPFVGVLLAAGASRRFGAENKLLATWRGAPLVAAAAGAMRAAGCASYHAIVSERAVAAALPRAFVPHLIAPGQEMSASVRAALDLAEAAGAARLLIALGDMPAVPAAVFAALGRAARGSACQCGGTPMPPLLLLRADFAAARAATEGDHGARGWLREIPAAQLVPLRPAEARDIDRPADLAAAR